MDERHMSEYRDLPSQCPVYTALARCIVEMVNAAYNMCNAHVMIINNHREVVRWCTVATEKYQIIEDGVLENCDALNAVRYNRFTIKRRFQSDRRIHSGGCIGGITIAPASIIDWRTSFGFR